MNITKPVAVKITGVEFGVLTPDEIHEISAKRITNPTTFDTLLHPVPGGLHDTALGACLGNQCATCGLDAWSCPGHCGHIDLPVPVYHPSFMDQTLRLIRAACVFCHRLKLHRRIANRLSCKLRLLAYGLLKEAAEVEDAEESSLYKDAERSDSEEEEDDDIVQRQNEFVRRSIALAKASGARGSLTAEKTEAVTDAKRLVLYDFFASINKSQKCSNCRGNNPNYRKDRSIKIFRKALSKKHYTDNQNHDRKAENAILTLQKRLQREQKHKEKKMPADEGVADMNSEGDDDNSVEDFEDEIHDDDALALPEEGQVNQDEKEVYLTPGEVHASLALLFEKERDILSEVYAHSPNSQGKGRATADMFFLTCIVVSPNKYRPEAKAASGGLAEDPRNSLYKSILNAANMLNQVSKDMQLRAEEGRRQRTTDDFNAAWVDLQTAVNTLVDSSKGTSRAAVMLPDGVKQVLEKKEGLFRMNMMGKRVNYAARTVLSPDPNIETNEIGVPMVFAKKLTYPEPVTNHNYYEMKELVLNGASSWPGAYAIENEQGRVLSLHNKNSEERQAIANQLLAPSNSKVKGGTNKKVYRHLMNGDVVLMNRQPTLHKPSLMAHRVRVLPGEKTFRLHYANTKTYNADFDGDEMNMHFPQNEVARAEALTIADCDHQYLSATAGEPLRGLIQDHISVGVALTTRDTFFTREEYQQLVYTATRPESSHTATGRVETVAPAIIKPQPLWTGKQLVTTVLLNIKPGNYPGLTLDSKSKTPHTLWGKQFDQKSEEEFVIFQNGDMVTGILDKNQIGTSKGGLISAVHEAYGHSVAGRLMGALGRLLTMLLHKRAFSCGVEDLVLTREGEKLRKEKIAASEDIGLKVASQFVTLTDKNPTSSDSELLRRLEEVFRDDTKQHGLDMLTNGANRTISEAITNACLPAGLIKPFPKNQMQAMTGSGAKGSPVNANLISCNLGQQNLEGRRVPIMVSGKSLPCFKPFEPAVRAGGYITDRFLTGIRPQEYYFHAMAGREGLIDTAVKTSRSGYLQRCVIKGLEGLSAQYDASVRDSDGSVIQFLYGEDGLDITKQTYLENYKFQAQNFHSLVQDLNISKEFQETQSAEASAWNKDAIKRVKRTGDIAAKDPALAVFNPNRHAGSTSETFYNNRRKYTEENPDKLINSSKQGVQTGVASRKTFESVMDVKYLKSIIEAGEAIGVVAGQSIGEPSTQMTLNTFHLAGHAAKNVTLGIPRLREIVMTATANVSTPQMTLYPISEMSKENNQVFAKSISRLAIAEIMDKITVSEKVGRGKAHNPARTYTIKLDFFPSEEYCQEYAIKVPDVERAVEDRLLPKLVKRLEKEFKKRGDEKKLKGKAKTDAVPEVGVSAGRIEEQRGDPDAELEGGDDDIDDDGDGDATNAKSKANQNEGLDYEAPDDPEEMQLAQEEASEDEEEDDQNREDEAYHSASSPEPDSEDEEGRTTKDRRVANAKERESRVQSKVQEVSSYSWDDDGPGNNCTFSLEYSSSTAKLLMLSLVEQCCRETVIHSIPGLTSCLATTEDVQTSEGKKEVQTIVTEGVNLLAMREYQDIINPHRIHTNSTADLLTLYGVEACRANIVKELNAVFSGHGIQVDLRHLNLIADYMTRGGRYSAFSRIGFASNPSPFMKMSFETTVGVLKDTVLQGGSDDLRNPSARIVTGAFGKQGTGCIDVLVPASSSKVDTDAAVEAQEMNGAMDVSQES